MNEQETVYLVAGLINATNRVLWWKDESKTGKLGDYYVVENMNGYDLVKVVGILATTKREASKFSNTKYENMKKIICGITKERIERC